MTTTPSTAIQAPAVSIDTPEFRDLLASVFFTFLKSDTTGLDAMAAFINHIDAKLAEAHFEKTVAERAAEVEARDRDNWKARATAAEAKLEAIRQGIDGLARWSIDEEFDSSTCEMIPKMAKYGAGEWVFRPDVLALLQPQHQADESGLPG